MQRERGRNIGRRRYTEGQDLITSYLFSKISEITKHSKCIKKCQKISKCMYKSWTGVNAYYAFLKILFIYLFERKRNCKKESPSSGEREKQTSH